MENQYDLTLEAVSYHKWAKYAVACGLVCCAIGLSAKTELPVFPLQISNILTSYEFTKQL
jgi:hypothetical protein